MGNKSLHKGLPEDQQPVIRVVPYPQDTNPAGDIFGGWIMSQVDVAGSIVASHYANGRVVTVAVNEFQFKQPVYVGDLVSCYGEVTRVGTTSLTVDVSVYAQRGWRAGDNMGEVIKVTEANLTYVAIDEQGNKRPVAENSTLK